MLDRRFEPCSPIPSRTIEEFGFRTYTALPTIFQALYKGNLALPFSEHSFCEAIDSLSCNEDQMRTRTHKEKKTQEAD